MPGNPWNKGPEEWQRLIVTLLKIRHGVNLVEVPDTVHGDCGIECFCRDGVLYQCYVAEEPLTTAGRSEKQKAKIRADFQKLIDNATQLRGLLGPTIAKRWVLCVPRWEDKDVLKQAEKHAMKVRSAGLSFIAADFAPNIITLEDFPVELAKLTRASTNNHIAVSRDGVSDTECDDWVAKNDSLVHNLDRKALAICGNNNARARSLRDRLVRHFLEGQNTLSKIRAMMPDSYEVIFRLKEEREQFLQTESLVPTATPPQNLMDTLDTFEKSVSAALPGIAQHTIREFTYEAISDWLMRCPLDYPVEEKAS